MKVSKLIETLSKFDSDDNVTFYFLKNDTLTNCQLEDIKVQHERKLQAARAKQPKAEW